MNTTTVAQGNEMTNICQHGAYADLCITCHPVDCEIVRAAIEYTKTIDVAAVDRRARENR